MLIDLEIFVKTGIVTSSNIIYVLSKSTVELMFYHSYDFGLERWGNSLGNGKRASLRRYKSLIVMQLPFRNR